jgi:FixJ family two-component response regulator
MHAGLRPTIAAEGAEVEAGFFTAHANDSECRQAMAGGAVDFLRKPFSEDALFAAIQAALNR